MTHHDRESTGHCMRKNHVQQCSSSPLAAGERERVRHMHAYELGEFSDELGARIISPLGFFGAPMQEGSLRNADLLIGLITKCT